MKKLFSAIAVAAALISATAVQAGPVVTQWGTTFGPTGIQVALFLVVAVELKSTSMTS